MLSSFESDRIADLHQSRLPFSISDKFGWGTPASRASWLTDIPRSSKRWRTSCAAETSETSNVICDRSSEVRDQVHQHVKIISRAGVGFGAREAQHDVLCARMLAVILQPAQRKCTHEKEVRV